MIVFALADVMGYHLMLRVLQCARISIIVRIVHNVKKRERRLSFSNKMWQMIDFDHMERTTK